MTSVPDFARFSIKSTDDKELLVTAQYNPKEFGLAKTVDWKPVSQANNANQNGLHLEFSGGAGRTLTLDLFFDGLERAGVTTNPSSQPVELLIEMLERMASIIDPGSPLEHKRRPHLCVAAWGKSLVDFRCVIKSLTTKYTMFSAAGVPLRATCTITLQEADVVSMAKAGAAGANQTERPATPTPNPTTPTPTGGR